MSVTPMNPTTQALLLVNESIEELREEVTALRGTVRKLIVILKENAGGTTLNVPNKMHSGEN